MKKVFAVILLISILVSTMTGCEIPGIGSIGSIGSGGTAKVELGNVSGVLVSEKIGILNRDDFYVAPGGLYYKNENGKFGLITSEGKYDTGAIYATCGYTDEYFVVSTKLAANYDDVAGLNGCGLVNARGKVLIPCKYASIKMLNDRYAKVVTITKRTYIKDEAIVTYTSNDNYSAKPTDSDVYYKGKWEIYDIVAGRLVNGITGSKDDYPGVYGNYITYKKGDTYVDVDSNGKPLSEDAVLFNDGSYAIEGKVGDVYKTDGTKLFSFDLTGFEPIEVSGNYYIARKYMDGKTTYAIMDKKGNVVSSEFNNSITVCGDLVLCDKKVYDFNGKNVYEGEFSIIKADGVFGKYYMISDYKNYVVIDAYGTPVYSGNDNDDYNVYSDYFVAAKKDKEYNLYFYSYAEKDYTIKGSTFAPWLVKTPNANNQYDIVNTINGNTVFKGYSGYSYVAAGDTSYYVYAKYNGGADVYLIISAEQLAEVSKKKENLLNELTAAFEKEGIKVTVNEATGELCLDSSVLFGGDSSELTADGKKFLNKFIKVYTNVAFSAKYDGFISKTLVEGHTAPLKGSTYASGLQLSEERAANVRKYCLSSETGVNVSKISNSLQAVGYSNSQPILNADGSVNMEASRRVSFRFMVNVTV